MNQSGDRAHDRPAAAREPLRVFIVDDHVIVRHGLRAILDRESDLCVVGEAGTPAEALAIIENCHPDIVLLDLKLSSVSDTEGLALCSELTERHPAMGILVLTTFLDDALVVAAIQRGARGYVLKDVDTSGLIRSIRAVAHSDTAFDPRLAGAMVRSIRAAQDEPNLTDRELGVLQLVAHGLSNREIGKQLYISETTTKFHVRNIMRKLSASSRAEAAYEASKLGLI